MINIIINAYLSPKKKKELQLFDKHTANTSRMNNIHGILWQCAKCV